MGNFYFITPAKPFLGNWDKPFVTRGEFSIPALAATPRVGNFYFITPAKPFAIREEIFFPAFVAAPRIQEKSHPYFSPDRE